MFATPLTGVFEGTPLTDYEIRYAGADESKGKVPPPGTPEWEEDSYGGYRGQFDVRVWVREAKEFKSKIIFAAKEEPIKGDIFYKSADTKQDKNISVRL